MSISSLSTSALVSTGSFSSAKPPPIITIPDLAASVSCPSSASSSESSSYSSPRLALRESGAGAKRRRINTRLVAKSTRAPVILDSEPPSPLEPTHLPLSRLELDRDLLPVPPRPPPLPTDEFIATHEPCAAYALIPFIASNYIEDSDAGRQISTCISSAHKPFSVSISSQPASTFDKLMGKSSRPRYPNGLLRNTIPSSTQAPTSGTSSPVLMMNTEESESQRKRARDVEQNKWWNWAKVCRTTGDGNKSAHAAVLKCQDLEPNPETAIVTKRAVACHLDGDITHPVDGSKWRLKMGL